MLKPVTLQPEQIKVLSLPANGAVQIKGVAGSGKTTVALYRAKYLIENYPLLFDKSKVVIFTYNRLLSNYIEQLLYSVDGGYDVEKGAKVKSTNMGLPVEVWNFHRWAYHFISKYGKEKIKDTIKNDQRQSIVQRLASKSNIDRISKSKNFLEEEISWIKGKLFVSRNSYTDATRTGRGNVDKLSKMQKEEIWDIYLNYQNELNKLNVIDFDDYAIIVLNIINSTVNFVPPYTHIVIDEAQDLNKAQLLAIKELVSKETNSITIIADNAQRIYKSGFTWAEVGLEFKGKTRVLKKNYRSTIQISKAAQALLEHESSDNDFTQIESARRGENLPFVKKFQTFESQMEFVVKELASFDNDISIVLLHRTNAGVEHIAKYLKSAKHDFYIMSQGDKQLGNSNINLCTLSSIKGLEFDVVFILDCNDRLLPFIQNNDDMNDELHVSTERRLLFTAMTRSRDQLYILSSGEPSIFISELPEYLITT